MRAKIICTVVAAIWAMVGLRALAQEIVPTPDPVGAAHANAVAGPTTDNWRYRWHEGRWWYWTPQNRWLWYSDDGRWIGYDANQPPPAADQSPAPAGYQAYYPSPGYSYPVPGYYPGYWRGYYYPGVAVGVRPYGNINVDVGPRIGVGVWGPHGGVHVGRIYVGW
jgi:hypothetical protein